MTVNEILELTRAGWSKDEIQALETPFVQSAIPEAEIPATGPDESVQVAQIEQTPAEETPAQGVDYSSAIEELKASLASLTRVVQENNLINRQSASQEQVETVDDILKKLI